VFISPEDYGPKGPRSITTDPDVERARRQVLVHRVIPLNKY